MTSIELRDICMAAAEEGARVLRELYDRPREVQFKGRIDLVTDADKASEETVLRVIRERAPGARILAEESGSGGEGEIGFIVDPLDGTTNYAHGLPLFPAPWAPRRTACRWRAAPSIRCATRSSSPPGERALFCAMDSPSGSCAFPARQSWLTRWSAPAFPMAIARSCRR